METLLRKILKICNFIKRVLLYSIIPPLLVVMAAFPTLVAINHVPFFWFEFGTWLSKVLPLPNWLWVEMWPLDMEQFGSNIICANFDTFYLVRGFIAFNNRFFFLSLVFFTIVYLSFLISHKWFRELFVIMSFVVGVGLFFLFLIRVFKIKELPQKFDIWMVYVFLVVYLLNLPLLFRRKVRHNFYISNRYFIKYIVWGYPVAFFAGLFYNVLIYVYLSWSIRNPDTLNLHLINQLSPVELFVIWSSSLGMWLVPFIMAWIHIFRKDFIDEYYRKTLASNISDLREHRVLLGYGGLGQGVLKELLERKESRQLEPLLDPSDGSSIRYLVKDMVIVDKDERLFDHVFNDPSFEKIGIAKTKYRNIEERYEDAKRYLRISEIEDVWVPALIGDITNESVDDYSKLAQCKFFIDAVKGYEATLRIAKVAHDNPEMKGIITVADSAQMELLFPRYSGHGVFFAYVTHQQGISLGEVVYPAMTKWLKLNEKPKILVFTDDIRQTHYMIETLVQELKLGDRLEQYHEPNCGGWQYDLGITICGDSEEIKSACHPRYPQEIGPPNFSLDVRFWNECIERCSKPEYVVPRHPIYVKSKVILEHPHLMMMEKMHLFSCIRPDIVVISFREASRALRTVRDWIGAVQRYNSPEVKGQQYKPVIIVGSLGEEQREVRDVLFYYDALPPNAMQSAYPVQAIDARVDLLKDSRQNIVAIADALESEKAIGIHTMLQNRAGTTPGILAALGGLHRNVPYRRERQLSFHYSRYYNCVFGTKQREKYFFFAADVSLEDETAQEDRNNIQSVLLSVPSREEQNKNVEAIKNLLNRESYGYNYGVTFGNTCQVNTETINNCLFQATCGPDAYRREVFNLLEHRRYFESFAPDEVKREFDRFYFNHNFNEAIRNKDFPPHGKPLAKLYLCCRHGNTPGALAIALNRLLGRIYNPVQTNEELFNITFLINYFTFNPKIMYEAIYGYLKRPILREICRNKLNRGVIERILICPISDDELCNNSWHNYAIRLHNALGGYREYELLPDYSNYNSNILIYRNGYPPCDIRKQRPKEHERRVPNAGCDICRNRWYGESKGWWQPVS